MISYDVSLPSMIHHASFQLGMSPMLFHMPVKIVENIGDFVFYFVGKLVRKSTIMLQYAS